MAVKLHKWHRRIGLLASIFIIFLVITGIVLQHSDELGLPNAHLANTWLLEYYGIKPNPITTFQLGNRTISHAGDQIYFSGKPIAANAKALYGAVYKKDEIVIATSNTLVVINDQGDVIDEITTLDGLIESPLGISNTDNGKTIIRGASKYWENKMNLFEWTEYQGPHPKWVTPSITLPALKQVIEAHDMSRQINLERFILDAHSGRFFGKYGTYVIDAAAILLLILSVTGIWLWSIRR